MTDFNTVLEENMKLMDFQIGPPSTLGVIFYGCRREMPLNITLRGPELSIRRERRNWIK